MLDQSVLSTLYSGLGIGHLDIGAIVMFTICLILLYMGIFRKMEPLLLVPIAFGGILANAPGIDLTLPEQFLGLIYGFGVETSLFPLLIFVGVGALTDFGPVLANPRILALGAAAQVGIFATLIGAVLLNDTGLVDLSIQDAAAIAIIGGADGPTSIYVASILAPDKLGAIAVAAYSYMALVPVIQPPIIKLLTTDAERKIKMEQLRTVTPLEKLSFPLILIFLTMLALPSAVPLVGALCLGNLLRVSGVTERLADTVSGPLIDTVTILLGIAIGSKLKAEVFLDVETLAIMALGLLAFGLGTASGVLMGKVMNAWSKTPLNPIIGAAGVSAVPMAARVASNVGQEADGNNVLLMHAMGPNLAGVLGSAVAAGVLIQLLGS